MGHATPYFLQDLFSHNKQAVDLPQPAGATGTWGNKPITMPNTRRYGMVMPPVAGAAGVARTALPFAQKALGTLAGTWFGTEAAQQVADVSHAAYGTPTAPFSPTALLQHSNGQRPINVAASRVNYGPAANYNQNQQQLVQAERAHAEAAYAAQQRNSPQMQRLRQQAPPLPQQPQIPPRPTFAQQQGWAPRQQPQPPAAQQPQPRPQPQPQPQPSVQSQASSITTPQASKFPAFEGLPGIEEVKSLVAAAPEKAQELAGQAAKQLEDVAKSEQGQQILKQIQTTGEVPPEVQQGAGAALVAQGADPETVEARQAELGPLGQFALWGGVAVSALGLLNMLSGNGGLGSALMTVLGLGTAGVLGAQQGLFGENAQQIVNAGKDLLAGGPQQTSKLPQTVKTLARPVPNFWQAVTEAPGIAKDVAKLIPAGALIDAGGAVDKVVGPLAQRFGWSDSPVLNAMREQAVPEHLKQNVLPALKNNPWLRDLAAPILRQRGLKMDRAQLDKLLDAS